MQYVICRAHTKSESGEHHLHFILCEYVPPWTSEDHKAPLFSHSSRPQRSRQFLADAASQRSVVPPHKTVGPFIPNFVHGMIFFLWEGNRSPLLQMTPRRIQLLSSSNNDPVALTPRCVQVQELSCGVAVKMCADATNGNIPPTPHPNPPHPPHTPTQG